MKFRLDLHFMRHRGVFSANLIGGRRVVLVKKLTGEKPAFDPPIVAVDQERGVTRGGKHEVRRRANFLGVA